MNYHLRTGDGKRYQDSKTGQNYRFDWRQFYRAFHKAVRDAGNGQGGVNEVEVRLVKAARDAGDSYEEMSEGEALMVKAAQEYGRQEKSHLYYFSSLERWRHKSPLAGKHPKDISVIRSYGAVLTGNEEAFLLPWTAAARPSISLDELRRWRQWEQRGFELGFSHNSDAQRIIQDVFAALWDIMSLYEISDGYNYRPDTGAQEGAEEYFDTLLKDALKKCDVERRSVEESLVVESLDPHLSDRLKDIVYPTEAFVKTHSLWIADLRWPESNPRLNYYDPVFELLEELPLDDFERLRNNFFYDHPTQRDIHLRRLYFSALEEQDSGGDMAYFQAELLDTLVKIFKKEF